MPEKISKLQELPHEILEAAYKTGIDGETKGRAGTFFHLDQSTVYSKINETFENKLEMMDLKDALAKYEWLKNYQWNLVDPDKDAFTQKVSDEYGGGYFIRILPHAEIVFPLQSCLFVQKKNFEQRVHNIIIAEEGSKCHIITGCVMHPHAGSGSHLGISEIYVRKNAELNFTMIHNWTPETFVRPRSATLVEDGGKYVSNYISLEPVKDVQMYPAVTCEGNNSIASLNSIIYAHKGSHLDIGSKIILKGKNSNGEVMSRVLAKESSSVIARGYIAGNGDGSKGHLECRGLLMDDESQIMSIPELLATRKNIDLTHEAAVGKIADKEITYLMSRRLSRDEAVSLIIRGFLNVGILGLPQELNAEIQKIVDTVIE
ncbi:MAG: SufB/SufD family protein [Candidatus Helarchaeota archaeon]